MRNKFSTAQRVVGIPMFIILLGASFLGLWGSVHWLMSDLPEQGAALFYILGVVVFFSTSFAALGCAHAIVCLAANKPSTHFY